MADLHTKLNIQEIADRVTDVFIDISKEWNNSSNKEI